MGRLMLLVAAMLLLAALPARAGGILPIGFGTGYGFRSYGAPVVVLPVPVYVPVYAPPYGYAPYGFGYGYGYDCGYRCYARNPWDDRPPIRGFTLR
jgi:hypothetical protein